MADLNDGGDPGTPTPPGARAWSAPPGWYTDPEGGGGKRYWDGTEWTERRPTLGNVFGSLGVGAVAGFFSVLFLGTILTEDCERDGLQYVCRSANLETTINIPILVVAVPVSVIALLGGIVGLISWFAATRRATPAVTGAMAVGPPATAAPSMDATPMTAPPASAAGPPTDDDGPAPQPSPPSPPVVGPHPAMGVGVLEQLIHESLQRPEADTAEGERYRMNAAYAIGALAYQSQAAGTPDGAEAVAALIRLLDVDSGYVPDFQVGNMKKTMLHVVVEQLAAVGGPAAVEPLSEFLTKQRELNASMGEEFTGTSSGDADHPLRRSAMAEDLFKVTAKALGELGDPRALPALTTAIEECHLGMKKAAKKAHRNIEVSVPQ